MKNDTDRKPWADQSPELREKTKMAAVRLPLSLLDDIARIAKRDRTTKAAVFKYALQSFVDGAKIEPQKPAKTGLFP